MNFDRDKPDRSVRLQHPAADESWPPKPIVRPSSDPPAHHAVGPHLEWGTRRLDWIWKILLVIATCVGAGWAGHAAMTAWSSSVVTVEANKPTLERLKKLEDDRDAVKLQQHDEARDLLQLRKDFDEYRNLHPDVIQPKPNPFRR